MIYFHKIFLIKTLSSSLPFLIVFFCTIPNFSQSVEEDLTSIEKAIRLEDGFYTGRLSISKKNGKSVSYEIELYQQKDRRLLMLISKKKGLIYRILYLREGAEIYVKDELRRQLYKKRDKEIHERIASGGFSYFDLSPAKPVVFYNPVSSEKRKLSTGSYIFRKYRSLLDDSFITYITTDQQSKINRIDYSDKDGIITRSLYFEYNDKFIKIINGGKAPLSRIESLDLLYGTVSSFEIYTYDAMVHPSSALFDPDFLDR